MLIPSIDIRSSLKQFKFYVRYRILPWLLVEPLRWMCGFLVISLLRALRPFIKVRFGGLDYSRIGNLSGATELVLRRQALRGKTERDIYIFFTHEPANRQLLEMIKRRVTVVEKTNFLKGLYYQYLEKSEFDIKLLLKGNEYDEFNSIPPQLSFTVEEEEKGADLLRGMGIEPGVKYVTFHARSKAYLDTLHTSHEEKWSYHDFRDCDIANFTLAAEYLTAVGYYALRTGYIVDKPLADLGNRKIIDYASRFRTDFGDIFLHARCEFFLGGMSGLREVPHCFNVPLAEVNVIPIKDLPRNSASLFIPKKLWDTHRKRFLTFRAILENGIDSWNQGEKYRQAGIELVENTGEEILNLTQEMHERFSGRWVTAEEDEELQGRFRAQFSIEHNCFGFPCRIGAEFLRQNVGLLG